MTGKQALEALLVELDKRKRSRIHRSLDEGSLADLIRSALDPQPAEENFIPTFKLPEISLEEKFPKLKVRRERDTGKTLEWIVLENGYAENPFRNVYEWQTEDMSKLEELKSSGIPERLLTNWERAQRDAAPKEITN